jgi:lipopolysaccharide export system protein LptA
MCMATLGRVLVFAGTTGLLLGPGMAGARSLDRQQPIHLSSVTFNGFLKPNARTVINDKVQITQGTLKATGTRAELYTDETGHIARIVLSGAQAHVQQLTDDGLLDQGDADRIDYTVTTGMAILTGQARVSKQSSGTSSGDEITYNLDTAELHATGTAERLVHVVLEPRAHVVSQSPSVAGSSSSP